MSKKYNFYADGGSTGLPAGAEQQFVNHYLNEGASAGVFEQGGSLLDGYLTDPNFGDFQAGIYDNGGQIGTKNVTIAKRIKVKKWYLKTYPKDDLGKEIREDITFWSLWAYMSQGYDVYNILGVGDSMIRERVFEELSKILGVDYDVVYQKWLNSDEYADGGEIEFQHSNLRIVGTGIDKNGNRVVKVSFPNQRPFSIQTNGNLPKTHSLLKDYDKKNTNFYKGEIESMEDEILDYIEKYGSENQKKSVRVYGSWLNKDDYAEGGSLGNHGLKQGDQIIKTMSGGVQKVKTRTGDIVYVNLANGYRGAEPPLPFKNGGGVDNDITYELENFNINNLDKFEIMQYNQFYPSLGKVGALQVLINNVEGDYSQLSEELSELAEKQMSTEEWNESTREMMFERDGYATGGVTKNYIDRNQLNTITIKKGDQKLTYKVSDVYNGAYKLEDGGNLEKMAFYVSKRNVVKVQLKNGKDVKVANGYWIKKGAKPIHTSKYDDGGMTQSDFMKKEIESQREKEKGKTFKDFRVNVYEQSGNKGAYPFVEPHFTDNFVEALNFAKETIKKQRNYRSNSGILWATIDSFTPIEKRQNVRYPYSELVRVDEEHINSSKYDDGGQLEMKFAGGGKIETKIQKKVDEVNALIEKAVDSDGDPLMVVDTTGTWEEPMQYKPIVYKNGRLYIEYFEPYSGKTEKDVINKSNVDFDGYPTLLNIAKMYRKALKKEGISYAVGGQIKVGDDVKIIKSFPNADMTGKKGKVLELTKNNTGVIYILVDGKRIAVLSEYITKYEGGGKTTFKEKATAIAKNFEGKKVEPKYQKEYGKVYDKAEAKEVGNKIAGSQKAKYDSKMSGGGKTKRGGSMVLAKQIRKDGESWASALKRANEQMRKK